jgi:hypothetical protein
VLAVEDAEHMGRKILVFIKAFYADYQARQTCNGCAACYSVEARSERDQAGRGMALNDLNRIFGFDKEQADRQITTWIVPYTCRDRVTSWVHEQRSVWTHSLRLTSLHNLGRLKSPSHKIGVWPLSLTGRAHCNLTNLQ